MLSPRDFLLLAVSFGSLLTGVLAPGVCAPFQPYPVVCMMLLLFLSFLAYRPVEDTALAVEGPGPGLLAHFSFPD